MRGILSLCAGLLGLLAAFPASAQNSQPLGNVVSSCGTTNGAAYTTGQLRPFTLDTNGNNCVNASVNASIAGFSPSATGARMTPVSVTTSDSSGTLPTGAVVVVSNVGTTNPMYCNVNGVAATTSDQLISAASWFAFTIPSGITTLHCIATGGSTTADGVGGTGLPTGAGGGSGGGSSSNASVSATGSGVPASATYLGASVSGSLTGLVATSNGLKTDGSAVTQPVSGTVTANAGTNLNTSALATDAHLTQTQGAYGGSTPATVGWVIQTDKHGTAADFTTPVLTNISQINGVSFSLGQATMSASLPVTIASNQSAVSISNATASSLLGEFAGITASGATLTENPLASGGRGSSTNPTAVTDGQKVAAQFDLGGEQISIPYANKGNMARGSASETGTSAGTILAASGNANYYEYITDIQCFRTDAGTTAIYVTINDSASSVVGIPNSGGGGGNNPHFSTPLRVAKNTAATFTASAGVSTVYCNAQGFYGP